MTQDRTRVPQGGADRRGQAGGGPSGRAQRVERRPENGPGCGGVRRDARLSWRPQPGPPLSLLGRVSRGKADHGAPGSDGSGAAACRASAVARSPPAGRTAAPWHRSLKWSGRWPRAGWLYSRVVTAVVHGFGRRPDPRSGDVHEFCQHRGRCQDSIGVFPVKGPGHADRCRRSSCTRRSGGTTGPA